MEQLNSLLGYISVFLWAIGICQAKVTKDKKRWVLSAFLCAGAVLNLLLYAKNDLLYWLEIILVFLLFMTLISGNWKRKCVLYLFSVFYIDIISNPIRTVVIITELLKGEEWYDKNLLWNMIEMLCILVMVYFIRRQERIKKWLEELPTGYYFIGFLCSFMFTGVIAYLEIQMQEEDINVQIIVNILSMFTAEMLYFVCIAIAVIATFCKHYKEENLLKDEYLRLSKQHYETLLKNTKEIRSLRHDMQSHINALAYFSEEKEWEKLQQYIEEVKDNTEKRRSYTVNVNHGFINAILEDSLSKEPEITFSCEGRIPADISIDDFDLCTIFSNLIRNAVEACSRLPEDMEKWVYLNLRMLQDNLYIRMENPVASEVDVKKLEGHTSKKDVKNHGYGIYNLKNAVEKYHGEVSFGCENQRFIAEIVFWNV